MNGELLVRGKEGESLDLFVAGLPVLIGCGPWQERESSNYPEGRYYRCAVLGLGATASKSDDNEFSDYDFQLYFDPEFFRAETSFLAELADCVARKLVISGYQVVRPFDSAHPGKGGLVYRFDPIAGKLPWEQVVTQRV